MKQEETLQYLLRGFADPSRPVILHLRGNRGCVKCQVIASYRRIHTTCPQLAAIWVKSHHLGDVALYASQVRQQSVSDVMNKAKLRHLLLLNGIDHADYRSDAGRRDRCVTKSGSGSAAVKVAFKAVLFFLPAAELAEVLKGGDSFVNNVVPGDAVSTKS
ncbi:hypothetical protein PoB_001893600 [Plakobranchus ocellatus]|uniref:Uncharacterized protein n=1 Tax=Plakobranchus ocellatus TaxID=259542 RepID=A0AAV3Z930_9GAST|nr:hypothetical protein PoB_001893600 [Plakobranchus ocellatus]